MSIYIENAKNEFIKYTEKFDLTNENIKRKQLHSLRVMEISGQIAKDLNLEHEKIEIAKLIGLLHDIARFEQYTQYKTFRDQDSFDHGDYGVKLLEKDIRKYIITDKYDKIIKTAIKNHNKYKIETKLTEEELLFSKLIRDADKIDIFYESVDIFWKGTENIVENSIISNVMLESFQYQKNSEKNRSEERSEIDKVISVLALIFDVNYKSSFKIIKENDYINKIINRYNLKDEFTRNKVEEIRKIVNSYIEQKIN